ncbi:hypothetical protein H310_13361 [Aphanomyces invadans]|uniref:Uncharacterized protein n=1 Tax=Aphanomyces invadans TaxID=157072 RepID=A0A024TFE3_9STRA|nr:hypothetical protein H310_13361 [Aphanomyces invadans]ETV92306.1 hypothetical protein H310_13361 [Aphanomyces invadans]RHY22050.1 hypothetical protein DYB32_009635 [Aphanomyces invadans]|eukprot:XP_008879057.1 hypothetical protein H310_13361 [Aphanomyces invadans]
MKSLSTLLQVATASQLVFDSLPPAAGGSFGTPVTYNQGLAVQFRSLDACGAPTQLAYVNFTVSTENVDNNSTYLEVALCPSENGLPKCPSTNYPERLPIRIVAKRIQYQWVPSATVQMAPSTLYWFVVLSNAEKMNHAVIWMDGVKRFTTDNDPTNDVLSAFTLSDAGDWAADPPRNNRTVSSMQVVAI